MMWERVGKLMGGQGTCKAHITGGFAFSQIFPDLAKFWSNCSVLLPQQLFYKNYIDQCDYVAITVQIHFNSSGNLPNTFTS